MKKPKGQSSYYLAVRTKRHLDRAKLKMSRRGKVVGRRGSEQHVELIKSVEFKYIRRLVKASSGAPLKIKESSNRDYLISLPENFSIIDNPIECLESMGKFYTALTGNSKKRIKIDHRRTVEHDLAAEILLAKIVKNASAYHKSIGKKVGIRGFYPKVVRLKTLIRSIGIVKELNIYDATDEDDETFEKRLAIYKRSSSLTDEEIKVGSIDLKTKAVQDFVTHIDQCLSEAGRKLTKDGSQNLAEYVGEILTNAYEHSGTKNWQIFGYLDKVDRNRVCEVVIYNFGKTISQTFNELPKDDFARSDLNRYLLKHRKSGLLGGRWHEDTLITLFSLQGSVSSKNVEDNSTRGHGTVSLIEFFQRISDAFEGHERLAKMCILSGHEHIRFDGKYRMQEESGRPIIAFNKSNELSKEPDSKYITRSEKVFFPGTLIAIQFQLPDAEIEGEEL